MRGRNTRLLAACAAATAGAGIYAAVSLGGSVTLTAVPSANTRSAGYAPATALSPQLEQIAVAQGSTNVENPTAAISYYGYDNDTLNVAGQPIMVASTASGNQEAHKTEPDKNTYLVFRKGLSGADSSFDYGTHFLFQGHETGTPGYITRINLDADAAHRVTVLATQDDTGARRHRRFDLGSVGAEAPVHDRGPERAYLLGDPRLSVAGT
jgi:hypothetical protein